MVVQQTANVAIGDFGEPGMADNWERKRDGRRDQDCHVSSRYPHVPLAQSQPPSRHFERLFACLQFRSISWCILLDRLAVCVRAICFISTRLKTDMA